jgi:hypothetical protein
MPVTRRPARSSFTLEVKRANRRTPEVLTRSKTSAPAATPLADQVFGKSPGRSGAQKSDQSDAPVPVHRQPVFGTNLPEATEPPTKVSPRRILPDLLTADVNPVKERLHREAVEQSTQRSTSRVSRARNEGTHRAAEAQGAEGAPAPVTIEAATIAQPSPDEVTPPHGSIEAAEQISTSRKRKRDSRLARHKKAARSGRLLPRLPAGRRWKCRLPKACW